MKRYIIKIMTLVLMVLVCALSCFPVLVLLVGSLAGTLELSECLGGLFADGGRTFLLLFPSYSDAPGVCGGAA